MTNPKKILQKHGTSEISQEDFYFESEAIAAMEEYASIVNKIKEEDIRLMIQCLDGCLGWVKSQRLDYLDYWDNVRDFLNSIKERNFHIKTRQKL